MVRFPGFDCFRCDGIQYLLEMDAKCLPNVDTRIYRRASRNRGAEQFTALGEQEAQIAALIEQRWFAEAR